MCVVHWGHSWAVPPVGTNDYLSVATLVWEVALTLPFLITPAPHKMSKIEPYDPRTDCDVQKWIKIMKQSREPRETTRHIEPEEVRKEFKDLLSCAKSRYGPVTWDRFESLMVGFDGKWYLIATFQLFDQNPAAKFKKGGYTLPCCSLVCANQSLCQIERLQDPSKDLILLSRSAMYDPPNKPIFWLLCPAVEITASPLAGETGGTSNRDGEGSPLLSHVPNYKYHNLVPDADWGELKDAHSQARFSLDQFVKSRTALDGKWYSTAAFQLFDQNPVAKSKEGGCTPLVVLWFALIGSSTK